MIARKTQDLIGTCLPRSCHVVVVGCTFTGANALTRMLPCYERPYYHSHTTEIYADQLSSTRLKPPMSASS